jgi:hypothetical protein
MVDDKIDDDEHFKLYQSLVPQWLVGYGGGREVVCVAQAAWLPI